MVSKVYWTWKTFVFLYRHQLENVSLAFKNHRRNEILQWKHDKEPILSQAQLSIRDREFKQKARLKQWKIWRNVAGKQIIQGPECQIAKHDRKTAKLVS